MQTARFKRHRHEVRRVVVPNHAADSVPFSPFSHLPNSFVWVKRRAIAAEEVDDYFAAFAMGDGQSGIISASTAHIAKGRVSNFVVWQQFLAAFRHQVLND